MKREVRIVVDEGALRVKVDHYDDSIRGLRGKVRGFTTGSRVRLINTLGRIPFQRLEREGNKPLFITLTIADSTDNGRIKAGWKAFREWLRRVEPKAFGVWRMEFQDRGALHLHVLLWNVRWLSWAKAREVWSRVMKSDRLLTVFVARARSGSDTLHYSAKLGYVAKAEETGPRAECIDARVGRSSYLADITYRHDWFGRLWGRIGDLGQFSRFRLQVEYGFWYRVFISKLLERGLIRRVRVPGEGEAAWGFVSVFEDVVVEVLEVLADVLESFGVCPKYEPVACESG